MRHILKHALINSLSTALYVVFIVVFISYIQKNVFVYGETIFIPILMLLIFVFSAAVTAMLVFGRPIMWYVDGKKMESIRLLVLTLGVFFILIVSIMLLFLIFFV